MSTSTRPLALVTGGSSGIGLELAKQFAEHGYDVAISGQSDRVHQSAQQLRELGVEAYPYQGDAGTYDGVEGFWQLVAGLDRPVAAAALNVGIGVGGAFVDTDLDDEFKLIAINVTGTVHMAKRVVQHMAANGTGRILILSSVSATTTALLPGATNSDFHANAGMGNTRFGDNSWKNDKTDVAQQGFEALIRGDDHVVGGDEATKQMVIDNRTTPEPVKAARQAESTRPDDKKEHSRT